ncbi:MAG: tRNA (N(6)-L-threonylcarbamoyladenosine(37)-C(2))-methylthiotransferase MtaB [Gammaproteobacteria bacterium]|nr:tRNA (N(6)-L-threonylcarbamoyladenosine(37)-C(2))-methylthiotransferase MtaB [Gammaproteobacteria bacterium]
MVSVAVNPPLRPSPESTVAPAAADATVAATVATTVTTPKRFAIFTLGCKVNSFESEHLAQQLSRQGHRRVDAHAAADLCLINTCTVTAAADRQARQLVRRAIRRHPAARIVVTGCYAQMDAAACAAIPGVDAVIGNARKLDIPALLRPLLAGAGESAGELPPTVPKVVVDDFAALDRDLSVPSELLGGFDGRARAFVQVQQGCDRGCTFCIIHQARGPSRSFPPDRVCAQVEKLAANGFREVVICGVDVGSYGDDFGDDWRGDVGADFPTDSGEPLAELLRRLATIDRGVRLRLSSIDPAHITDSLIDLVAAGALCPQLHLSLQSADTLILKRMRRRANRDMVYERIAALRRAAPHLTLSADILVGFPTETDAQFRRTLAAVDDLEIAWPHVFAYSPRRGTPAARIPPPRQVPPAERKQRAAAVRAMGRAVWERVAKRRIGARLEVLVEGRVATAGTVAAAATTAATEITAMRHPTRARAADYFPVLFDARAPAPSGQFAAVEVTAVGDGVLIARQRA